MIDVHAHVQDLLADGQPLGPLEREHLDHCERCSAVAESLRSLDGLFAELPQDEPPPTLVAATIAAVHEAPDAVVVPRRPLWRRPAVVAACLIGGTLMTGSLVMSLMKVNVAHEVGMVGLFETADSEIDTVDANLDSDWGRRDAPAAEAPALSDDGWGGAEGLGGFGSRGSSAQPTEPAVQGMRRPTDLDGANFGDVFRPEVRKRVQTKRNKSDSISIVKPGGRRGRSTNQAALRERIDGQSKQGIEEKEGRLPLDRGPSPEPTPSSDTTTLPPAVLDLGLRAEAKNELGRLAWENDEGEDLPAKTPVLGGELSPTPHASGLDDALAMLEQQTRPSSRSGRDKAGEAQQMGKATSGEFGYRPDVGGARAWLDDRAQLGGLAYKEAAGYWRNTYVPGDPVLRRVQSRLRQVDPSGLGLSPADGGLDLASRQVRQPFDRPVDSALAAYLHADRRGVDGPTRMRVQVGIQATERRSGRRPTMNIAVVLDLTEAPADADAASMRAFLEALSEARDLGDTFSLVLAGRPGGVVLPPGEFRYGPVSLALRDAFGDEPGDRPVLNLDEAFAAAIEAVSAGDDPNAPLGSSAVLLLSARDLRGDLPTLTTLAHSSGVAGIPVSAIGVGSAEPRALEAIALAGQGNRRLLPAASEARELVQRELTAASRAVARAVRLRIRLAPGVELVNVLGSERLDQQRAEQIREAEKSIDVRLSRNLGIEADRGDDEEGIQIVVPAWYAGDAHVFLLDVVVPGPGPIADVTVRYKDLVRLNNGVARSSLQLGRDPQPPGPLELNVLKNELARHLSDGLLAVADDLRRRDPNAARARLQRLDGFLRGMRIEVPALRADAETSRDLELLAAYREAVLRSPRADAQDYLRDSLFYAAGRKVLPPDAEENP